MTELRWLLLVIGLVVIAAIWFFSRNRQREGGDTDIAVTDRQHAEPYLGGYESTREEARDPAILDDTEPREAAAGEGAPANRQLILTMHVVAPTEPGFDAVELAAALTAADLEKGRFGIYHYTGDDGAVWFSAANLVEPGQFPEPGSGKRCPGITLFMMAPGPAQPQQALEALLTAAGRLAATLKAHRLDERRHPFTAQSAQRMREELAAFQLKVSRKEGVE